MKNETLKQIIEQIKKYKLTNLFSDIEEFEDWISKLNSIQVNNFLNLNIDLEEVINFKSLLINSDLLNCNDYIQKVQAISTLKNGDGCWHLYSNICSPNFLKSKNFYKDIEMLSKADTARYGLWILGEDSFINSPYHDEDLKLLVEIHDTNEDNPLDFVVSDAIATVAGNIDSIKSPYHQMDMKLIATAGSSCLQMSHSYPGNSLNYLAINKVSLADKYHLENMQILATNPIARKFLYIIMTDSNFVNGKNYRKEVKALKNAKSKITARALYYYIVNPQKKYMYDIDYLDDYEFDENDAYILDKNSVVGSATPDYINNLSEINKFDDKFVMYFVSLLVNSDFINSQYKNFDLELLKSVSDKSVFMDLYRLMNDKNSLNSSHHKKDAVIISQTLVENIRKLLLKKATNESSLNSSNHDYDMEYILKLNLNSIDEAIYDEIKYYLFRPKGINDPEHKEKLEKLLQGILVERSNVSSYLDILQSQISSDCLTVNKEIPVASSKNKSKSRILNLFKKNIKKKDD